MQHTVMTYDPSWFDVQEDEGATQLQIDSNRQAYLESLYERDGRHDPAHPMHGLWTGLAITKRAELTAAFLSLIGDDLYNEAVSKFHLDASNARFFEANAQKRQPAVADQGAEEGTPAA
jgi:hypothetical protein